MYFRRDSQKLIYNIYFNTAQTLVYPEGVPVLVMVPLASSSHCNKLPHTWRLRAAEAYYLSFGGQKSEITGSAGPHSL